MRSAALCLLLSLLLLGFAGTRHAGLVTARSVYHLQDTPPEDTTPLVALTTVAFGGFRGLVADALWVRANELQEQGQYFELVQLSAWISQLEPRVPQVWSFQAWNLAYNLSVLFPDPDDRWRWVLHGLNLLRNDGLLHNPRSADLHWDIGWMFQHKIGMEMDQAHPTYKRRLAEQVQGILGGPSVPVADPALLHRLREEFHMDFAFLQDLDTRFGPLDWRTPTPHVLYWATRGIPLAKDPFRLRMLLRMRMQALGDLVLRGRILGDPTTGETIGLPRPELLPTVLAEYRAALDASSDNPVLRRSLRGFLLDSIQLSIESSDLPAAWDFHQVLASIDPEVNATRGAFEALVARLLSVPPEELTREQALLRINARLLLAARLEATHPTRAAAFRQIARQTHRLYQESRHGREHLARTGLPPLAKIEAWIQDFVAQERPTP